MRTDSVNLADSAIQAARQQIRDLYGDRFVPPQPRRYTSKVKNAQEAHEAIRPAGDVFRTPGEVANELSTEEFKLYAQTWRRSSYASIMATIQDRGYVFKRGQALVPSFLAFAVINLLEQHFPRLVDYRFTASMEDELDDIAGGGASAVDFLTAFYFGGGIGEEGSIARAGGLQRMVTQHLGGVDHPRLNSIPLFQ